MASGFRVVVTFLFTSALTFAAQPIFDTEPAAGGPMPAQEATAKIALPPGFRATLFAAEPDVRQPIAMTTDTRGRLWVVENYTYSERSIGWHPEMRDRIVIFEDTDNDGRHDRRTIFLDGAERLTSIELGRGGVWAICLPNLVFIPDRNGDDVPDGAPEIILDGFEYMRARHNVANGLRWGPDGWLYGRQGILGHSKIGMPGTPEAKRTALNAGIWRLHPERRTFEIVCAGTTNPWGMDWDQHGELFFINTVIGHLWHAIPGAHYRRMSGDDPNPRIYELIEQHSDHVHWATGEVWTDVRKGITDATNASGGGHAHSGLLIYQGGQWPKEWQGKLLTVNYHGRRLNVERFEREGSAYVGRREPDAFQFPDPRFRGVDIVAAPDGGVFVNDWNDDGECHDNDGIHRSSGRIFKLSFGPPAQRPIGDLAQLNSTELVKSQRSENEWLVRQSRRVLVDRAAGGGGLRHAFEDLTRWETESTNSVHRLRALWVRHSAKGSDDARLMVLLEDRDELVRAWAIRLLLDDRAKGVDDATGAALARLAAYDKSPRVRLALASALQRLPASQAAAVASGLLARFEDVNDHNIPLMLWYGIEPLAGAKLADFGFEKLLASARFPRVQRLGARRLAEEIDLVPARLDALLERIASRGLEARQAVLDGLAQGLSGRRRAPKPAQWDALQPALAKDADDKLRRRIRDLNALFGDGRALEEIRAAAMDASTDLAQRRAALQVLVESRSPLLRETCTELIKVRGLAALSAAGLAVFEDPALADYIIKVWADIGATERASVMNALVSRPTWAARIVAALESGVLRKPDVSLTQVRQIRSYHLPIVARPLDELWGPAVDESERDRDRLLAKWSARFTPQKLAGANPAAGRLVFNGLCGSCHVLNGEGGKLGPDLTGAARDNLAYLLENILFPSAVVADEHRMTTLTLKDGRVFVGMVRDRSGDAFKVQTMADTIPLSKPDVLQEETSSASLMPPGLLDGLATDEARDLVAYLMTK